MFQYICLFLSVFVATTVSGATLEKRHGKGMHNMTCKGEPLTHSKEMHTFHKDCFDQIFPATLTATTVSTATSSEEKGQRWKQIHNNTCFDVCLWKKKKMLNDDGSYNPDGTNTMIKANFPTTVQADVKKALDDCASSNSKSFSMDNKCEGYKKFRECKHAKIFEICDIKMANTSKN